MKNQLFDRNRTPPEVIKDLVNCVARAFYSPAHVVVLQALLGQTQPIVDGDLSNKINLPYRETCRLLGDLKNEFLVAHSTEIDEKKELELYCINYDTFINVVRLRMTKLKQWVDDQAEEKRMGYYCVICNKGYSEFDMMKLMDFSTERCRCDEEDCDGEIVEDIEEFRERTGSEIPLTTLFEMQLKHILEMVEMTSQYIVPKNTRCNVNTVTTIAAATQRNIRSEKESILRVKGTKYDRLERSLLTNERSVEVNLTEEEELKRMGKSMEDVTPFFLKEDRTYLTTIGMSNPFGGLNQIGRQPIMKTEGILNVGQQEFDQNFKRLLINSTNETKKPKVELSSPVKRDNDGDVEMEDKKVEDIFAGVDAWVSVNGVQKKLSEITETDEQQMTEIEYKKYCEVAAGDQDDDWE